MSAGNIAGAPGVTPGTPAEGFTPEVKGTNTDATNSAYLTVTPEVLGESNSIGNDGFDWRWLLLFIPLYFGVRYWNKKKNN